MNPTSGVKIRGCLLTMLALVACGQPPSVETPMLEEISTAFLKAETEAVASRVRAARNELLSDPASAAKELTEAEDGLDHLLTYYLPLLEARESTYNAYRHHHLGDTRATGRELDKIETILRAVAKSGHGHLLRQMDEPLVRLEHTRAALGVDEAEASAALRELATRLNLLLVKGGLVLRD